MHPFQSCAIDADCAVKPDGQSLVISFVTSKWLLPELWFSDCWSRGKKTGNEIARSPLPIVLMTCDNSEHFSRKPLVDSKFQCLVFNISSQKVQMS